MTIIFIRDILIRINIFKILNSSLLPGSFTFQITAITFPLLYTLTLLFSSIHRVPNFGSKDHPKTFRISPVRRFFALSTSIAVLSSLQDLHISLPESPCYTVHSLSNMRVKMSASPFICAQTDELAVISVSAREPFARTTRL